MAGDMNKSKRQFCINAAVVSGNTEVALQATNGRKLSEDGSLRLIHGKTITLPMIPVTTRQRRGSFKEKLSQNGNRLDYALFYGSTGNVSCCSAVTL
jgi:hypothetical protein